MDEITKARFMELLEKNVIVWPPVELDGKIYGKSYEGNAEPDAPPFKFVWCTV